MNTTTNVNLGGVHFVFDEDAYHELRVYLDRLQATFAADEGRDEIIADIESRIAEQCQQKLGTHKTIVSRVDINVIIASMGMPEDMAEAGDAAGTKTGGRSADAPRKLMRDTEQQWIAGVCAGLAVYFSIDVTLVRVAFAILIFVSGGFGIFVYLVLWLAMPAAVSSADKIAMQGKPITAEAIAAVAKERYEEAKHNPRLQQVGEQVGAAGKQIGQGLSEFFKSFGAVLAVIVGSVVVISMAIALISLVFSFFATLLNLHSPYVDFPLAQQFSGELLWQLTVVGGMIVAVVPLVFALLLGVSLIRRKMIISMTLGLSLLGIWLVAVLATGVLATRTAPEIVDAIDAYERSIAVDVREVVDLPSFTGVVVGGGHRVHVNRADIQQVRISGSAQTLDKLELRVRNGRLYVERRERWDWCIFCIGKSATITIELPTLDFVQLSGGASGIIEGYSLAELNTQLSGGADLIYRGDAERIDARLSGAAELSLVGSGTEVEAVLSGAAELHATEYVLSTARLRMSGASSAEVAPVQLLIAELSGAAYLDLQTTPVKRAEVLATGGSRMDLLVSDILIAELSGASRLESGAGPTGDVQIKLSGGSSAKVHSTETLDIQASGGSSLRYVGTPRVTQEVGGGSTVRQVGE
jgi:phage shock protein PspC (stress-responsive transcriptional regulator)